MQGSAGSFRAHGLVRLVLIWAAVAVLSGCASGPTHYRREDVDFDSIRKVAVLPLESFVTDRLAGERVRMAVISELLSRGVDVTEPGEVIRALRTLNVESIRTLSSEEVRKLGQALGVDAVITGSVGAFGIEKGVSVSYAEVSISLIVYESSTGEIIGSSWHSTQGASFWTRHFGAEGKSLPEATREVVRKSIDVLF
ncbi:MAG: hypothetical protein Kow0025_07390 [Thermodesulfovibrionales bacterium]